MTGLAWSAWAVGATAALALVTVCAAVGWWHHRRDAARLARGIHELRGPLGALRLGVDLGLSRGGLPPERVRALDLQLRRATLALAELGGAELGGAGNGHQAAFPEAVEPVELGGLLSDCVAALAPLGAQHGVSVEVGEVSAASVLGSPGALAQALSNLIQNAVEHGAGPVTASCRPAGTAIRLEVSDHGPGLGRPLGQLLNRGRRPGWAAATGPRGHGLRVAAQVAAAHGGRLLSAPSERGARLALELPLPSPERESSGGSASARAV